MRTTMMTTDAKRALAKTIRTLRARLITDLGEATERAYRLSIDAKKAQLDEAGRVRRARFEGMIDEQVRALPAKGGTGAAQRLRDDVIKDAAATLLLRLVYLRLLEASGLQTVKVVTGGWDSRGYKDFREVAPELVRADETEGYAALLGLVFDELAHDLPGLYGPVRMTPLVPVPAATLRAVVDALDDAELASVWTDDTTLGWIYQYWNDPEREALDAKLAASKKLENHEIASKTQMFTERYMVEWLLHNTLGQTWLAMCQRHGWTARVRQPTGSSGDGPCVLDQLDTRRAEWRKLRELGPDHGGVALDALMPIEMGLEDRWKYWVPQPMPDVAVAQAPASVRELKLLDPACGSGHFLVIAFELLFNLYQEEAALRGETWAPRAIVEGILENNLHGIDIDPKAVQIAAAALMLKARQLCAEAEPAVMNLVAPALSLASLAADDPALRELSVTVLADTGIPPELTARIVSGLAGADHLGTLLRVDVAIDEAIATYGEQLTAAVPTKADQGSLFTGFAPARRKRVTAEHAKAAVLDRLEGFLAQHSGSADLGLRLRGEQLAAGVRFVRLVREGQYDIVIGNPPYQGTSKMADKAYVEAHYPRGKSDLYAAFLERGLQLARTGGVSALLTMRTWMFIKQFSALREWIVTENDLCLIGDVGWGAFREMKDNAVTMSITRSAGPRGVSIALAPSDPLARVRTLEHFDVLIAGLLAQVGTHQFSQTMLTSIEEAPLVYWWTPSSIATYCKSPKIGTACTVRQGLGTRDNPRFVREQWEVPFSSLMIARFPYTSGWSGDRWVPFPMGAGDRAWFEPLSTVVDWDRSGIQIGTFEKSKFGRGASQYFQQGVAFSCIGTAFRARLNRYSGILADAGASVFSDHLAGIVALLNSTSSRDVLSSLNPTVNFNNIDVNRLPVTIDPQSSEIINKLELTFEQSEQCRETAVEFRRPGASAWRWAQEWAQTAIDRLPGASLTPFEPVFEVERPTDHLSFAIGVALGRFGGGGEGVRADAPASALPHGILFLADAYEEDSLAQPAAATVLTAWAEHGPAIDDKRTLKNYLQEKFFSDVHRKMYENRPIYFPLSSAKKAFVAYVSIHRWTAATLNHLLAEHLYPTKKRLEGELADLRAARDGADRKASKAADKRFGEVGKWIDELTSFIAAVEQCAESGPPSPDDKTTPRDADARYVPDLDDGVMINSAALWPLLESQWKDPRKWWKQLANAEGNKDYDWSQLAARYFPDRVDAKCQTDPSLAVAHGRFWKYHPAKAYQWELRLQDEIRPDFTLDEPGSDAARAAFEAAHPDEVQALVTKEHVRRQRKLAKAAGASADDDDEAGPQGSLGLDEDADGDAATDADA